MAQKPLSQRKVILVDENDHQLGVGDLLDAHRGEGKLHRAASVFLFRKNTDKSNQIELLLQQRSSEKIVGAREWANTVCGNVEPGESYEQCAARRLSGELGIGGVSLSHLLMFRYQARCNDQFSENEMDAIFAGWYDGPIAPNPDEVAQIEWVSWPVTSLDPGKTPAPWFALFLKDSKIKTALEKFLKDSP